MVWMDRSPKCDRFPSIEPCVAPSILEPLSAPLRPPSAPRCSARIGLIPAAKDALSQPPRPLMARAGVLRTGLQSWLPLRVVMGSIPTQARPKGDVRGRVGASELFIPDNDGTTEGDSGHSCNDPGAGGVTRA